MSVWPGVCPDQGVGSSSVPSYGPDAASGWAMNSFEQKSPENLPCFLHCASVFRIAATSSALLEKQKFSSVAPHSVQKIPPPAGGGVPLSFARGTEGRFC